MSFFQELFCSTELGQITKLQNEKKNLEADINTKMVEISNLENQLEEASDYIEELVVDNKAQKEAIELLNTQVPEPLESWEILWEQKFKKTKIKWVCRPLITVEKGKWIVGDTVSVDVMSFWQPKTIEETAILIRTTNIAAYKAKDWDTLAYKCEEWVKKKIKYKSELPQEYWKFPWETERDGSGDCDDGAIYLCNLMYAVGIPPGRIKACVGEVEGGKHYYTSYCRTTDNKHVILDWCFWTTTKQIKDRPLHSDNYKYYDVQFSITPKATWAKPDFKGVDA